MKTASLFYVLTECQAALAHLVGLGGGTHESILLGLGLEATVTELGSSIDELEFDLFQSVTGGLGEEGLAKSDDTFLGTDAAALDHDEIFVDFTVVGEATERGDGLVGKIGFGGSVVVDLAVGALGSGANGVDLLVHLSTVVITVLTSAGNVELDSGRVPGTDTSDLAETSVGLTGKAGGTPTSGDTFETFTFRDTDDIDHLVLGEDGIDGDLLFEESVTPVDLGVDITTVDLDFEHVSLLLAETDLADVGVAQQTDNGTELLHAGKFSGDIGVTVGGDAFGVTGESLLLGVVPVLVEGTLDGLLHVLGPDGGQGAETAGGFDVTDKADGEHGGSFDDGDGFNDFLLVDLGAGLVGFTHDVGHTGFVAHKSSEVRSDGSIVLGEGFNATLDVGATLTGEEPEGTVTGGFELTVRHLHKNKSLKSKKGGEVCTRLQNKTCKYSNTGMSNKTRRHVCTAYKQYCDKKQAEQL